MKESSYTKWDTSSVSGTLNKDARMQFDGFEQYTYISVTIGYLDQAVDAKYIEQMYIAVFEFVTLNWQNFQS